MTDHTDYTHYIEDNTEFITPPNIIKSKVGHGGIPEERLRKCQEFIESNTIDFKPYAEEHLNNINGILKLSQGTKSDDSKKEYLEEISQNIMQLKASGSMFGFHAVTQIADTVLNFVERATTVNDDLYKIIESHNACLTLVLSQNIKGNNVKKINVLTNELYDAIDRYENKYTDHE
ncbi:MAG: hypothetical protein CMH31_06405 [Micavibrio sp.]|nr:hypothetical protein [Micavibrio sp.]|tara:strand:- start:287 stop:814 length:528 start_codon:yes stop_codon:yes gene_type:complete